MVDDLPSPEQGADNSRFQRRLQFKSDQVHMETHPKPEKAEKIMQKRKVNYENIEREIKAGSCCYKNCITLILTKSGIYKTREWFFKKSREAQGQFLLNFFQVARRSKGQRTVYAHSVEEKDVCQKAWIFSHGIAYGRYVTLYDWLEKQTFTNAKSFHQEIAVNALQN